MTDTASNPARRLLARRRARRGFTLIELLVVLVILGLIIGFAAPRVIGYLGGAKSDAAQVQVQGFAAALDLFRLDVGRYPTEQEGLDALVTPVPGLVGWNGPYLNKNTVPADPWGAPYLYRNPTDNGGIAIYSLGADASEGGDGENSDIYNN